MTSNQNTIGIQIVWNMEIFLLPIINDRHMVSDIWTLISWEARLASKNFKIFKRLPKNSNYQKIFKKFPKFFQILNDFGQRKCKFQNHWSKWTFEQSRWSYRFVHPIEVISNTQTCWWFGFIGTVLNWSWWFWSFDSLLESSSAILTNNKVLKPIKTHKNGKYPVRFQRNAHNKDCWTLNKSDAHGIILN